MALPRAGAHHPGGRPHPRHPQTEAGQLFPNWLEPRRRVDKALYAVVMEDCTGGISTLKVVALVEVLGGASGISKSEESRIFQGGTGVQVKAFLSRPLDHARFPCVSIDATYPHCRLGCNLQVVSRAVVVAIGINALGYHEVLGIAVGASEAVGLWRQFLGSLKERGLDSPPAGDLRRPSGPDGSDQAHVPGHVAGVAPRGALGCPVIKRRTNVVGIFPNDATNGLRPTSSKPGCWSSRRNGNWSSPMLVRPTSWK